MKSMRNLLAGSILAAGALATAAAGLSIASAADDTTTATTGGPEHGGWHHHRGGPWHMLHQLGLSDAQKTSVKQIMTAAHPQMESLHKQMHANSLKLRQTQPNSAQYASVVQEVSQANATLSAQMTTQMADVRKQVFNVLTPPQQTQLATLEAQMQANMAAHESEGPRGE